MAISCHQCKLRQAEIDGLKAQIVKWRSNHAEMVLARAEDNRKSEEKHLTELVKIELLGSRSVAFKKALKYAREYTGYESSPCPFCKWEDGKLLESCGFHKEMELAAMRLDICKAQAAILIERKRARDEENIRLMGDVARLQAQYSQAVAWIREHGGEI